MNAAHFGSAGRVYTPQMVVDGRTELVVAGRVDTAASAGLPPARRPIPTTR
jgi:hypothetical protein